MFIGRLGNQLFQYSFLLYLKSKNPHLRFFFPNPHHAQSLVKYFDLGLNNNLKLNSKIYSVFTRLLPKLLPFKNVSINSIGSPKEIKVNNNTIYWGYYQTDWYLNNTQEKLQIKIKTKYKDKFEELYGAQFNGKKTIAVHIRRTDYLNYHKRDISLPIEYFKARLSTVQDLDSYQVFFLSDDIEYVKKSFDNKPNFVFSGNEEIIDFQIIMNADICIISNSSFSWWAAYLNEKTNTVYAPKNWIGFRIGKSFPNGIMTDKFIWCDVIENDIMLVKNDTQLK